jgi:hypothetical protein
LSVAASLTVILVFLLHAAALVAYPWDWSPDEGLQLDYARRLLRAPETLYARRAVPIPDFYGPVGALAQAPAAASPAPVTAGRGLALVWTALSLLAIYVLVRQRAGPVLGLASVALVLAPLDRSFWFLLIRSDGPMLALWLWAAVALLPAELRHDASRLSPLRTLVGSSLLAAAVLARPLAALHGAPLLLGWLLVDRRSALRLLVTTTLLGGACVGALQVATAGGFVWVMGLWGTHELFPWHPISVTSRFLGSTWPLFLLLAVAFTLAERRARADGALLLWLGGLLAVPTLAKYGSSWNYLMPWLCATAVLVGRLFAGRVTAPAKPTSALGAILCSLVALGVAARSQFPLPTRDDRRTADAFYGFLGEFTRLHGGPLLVARPELAYFHVGQPVEIEGSSHRYLLLRRVPGTERILERLVARDYTLVAGQPRYLLPDEPWHGTLARGYEPIGVCILGYYFGPTEVVLLARRGETVRFEPPPATRCQKLAPSARPRE